MPEAALILLAIGTMIGLMGALPALAAGFAKYLESRGQIAATPGDLESRVKALEATVASLSGTRETSLQHALSVEKNLETLQSRIENLERRAADNETSGVRANLGG